MFVIKRNGRTQGVSFDKITARIARLCYGLHAQCDPILVAQKVAVGVYSGVKTSELDELAAETAAALTTKHPDYAVLAARILVSNLHKNTAKSFSDTMRLLYENVHPRTGDPSPFLAKDVFDIVCAHAERLDQEICHERDLEYDYFGFKTLERSYLIRIDGRIIERPQHMLMRCAIGIHKDDIDSAIATYHLMSERWFTHASPTLFNAGTPRPALSSCFLLSMKSDSIEGIFDTLKDCALISKNAGGIGLSVHDVRASGSFINGTNGISNGLVPMLRVFNDTARYVDQCFTPDTLVCTRFGAVPIESVCVGDEVLTAAGSMQKVDRVLEHQYSGPVLRIFVDGLHCEGVRVTPEHQVLCLRNDLLFGDALDGDCSAERDDIVMQRIQHGFSKPHMVDAKELRVGDFVCFPKAGMRMLCDTEHRFVYDDMIYKHVSKIEDEHYAGIVYDFEVATEHTYVTMLGAVHNGGGKRKGAFAIYLEPWHADIFEWLDLRKNHGKDEMRARDLFYGLWIPDLFMKRVKENGVWSLFCPKEAPGLADVWGPAFDELYEKYESLGRARKVIKAQQLWFAIVQAQIETGTPYMLYKDACNAKSNQQNLGTIRSSNLCTEIIEFSSPDEIACCNLASIALPRFVKQDNRTGMASMRKLVGSIDAQHRVFDFDKLAQVTETVTRNLNKVIDVNYYPTESTKRSNLRHRPIGIGVQGLADTFILLGLPFDSPEAAQLNRDIAETIYFSALKTSCELAELHGPYASYAGSPVSNGILQHDMWGVVPSSRWDWDGLRAAIAQHGVRNSLLIAPMPTASTSQILGNTEAFEPITSNIYVRRVLSGEFVITNKHLLHDLVELGLWTADLKNQLVAADGSVANIKQIPDHIKALYKTVWEIKQRVLIDMAADRAAFIDQSQSLNVFVAQPDYGRLTSLHFYTWSKGLKTGSYYLRTKAAADAIKFTVDQQALAAHAAVEEEEGCLSCGA